MFYLCVSYTFLLICSHVLFAVYLHHYLESCCICLFSMRMFSFGKEVMVLSSTKYESYCVYEEDEEDYPLDV